MAGQAAAAPGTLAGFIKSAEKRLSQAGIESARLDAELLLAAVLGTGREALYAHPDRLLSGREYQAAQALIERRERREPVSYLLGRKGFWDLEFSVSPAVLVPRPETECLIERFLEAAGRAENLAPVVLDIGTGSGNIAVVAARALPLSRVVAVDISPAALAVARENVQAQGVAGRVRLISADLFSAFGGTEFDFILSNPPYIETGAIAGLIADVSRHEPALALDGGGDGLDVYRRLIPEAARRLKPGGVLIMEIGETQAAQVSQLIEADGGFEPARVSRDLSGRDRVIEAARRRHG